MTLSPHLHGPLDHYSPPEPPTHLINSFSYLLLPNTQPKMQWPYWVKQQFIIVSCSSWVDWIPPNSFSLGFSHAVAVRLQMWLVPQWLKELGGAQASLCPCTLSIRLSWTSSQGMVLGWFNFLCGSWLPPEQAFQDAKPARLLSATISTSTSF